MPMEWVIDGYNFLMARTGTRLRQGPGNLERARNALLAWLARHAPEPERLTIVFDAPADAPPRLGDGKTLVADMRVIYSIGYPDADGCIAELIRVHSAPKQLTVVSDDRAVQRSARRRGAHVQPCASFERMLLARPKRPPPPSEPIEKSTGASGVERDHWLRAFEGITTEADPTPDPAMPPASGQKPAAGRRRSRRPSNPGTEKETPVLGSLADFYREMLEAPIGLSDDPSAGPDPAG